MRTASEKLLETYLTESGLRDFDYEPVIEGITRRPDYRVRVGNAQVFCEVKEFEPQEQGPGVRCVDPYPPIRSKINDAQKQLRALKGRMCVIMLANPYSSPVFLDPILIYGAMLGDVGITRPFEPDMGVVDRDRASWAFLSGGKMNRYRKGNAFEAQNTTISAICVLGQLAEGSRWRRVRRARRKRETGRPFTLESRLNEAAAAQNTEADSNLYRLRIQVYENPYAAVSLTRDFGAGPWDERFGERDGRPSRVFVGYCLAALEAEERAAGVEQHDPGGLRRG